MKKCFRCITVALLVLCPMTAVAAEGLSARRGTFVSVDAVANTVTLQADNGQSVTIRVEGVAIRQSQRFAVGDRVRWAYRDDSTGAHQAIILIRRDAEK